MQALLQISINFAISKFPYKQNAYPNKKYSCKLRFPQPISYNTGSRVKFEFVIKDGCKIGALRNRLSGFGSSGDKDGILMRKGRRVVLANFKKGFNEIGGGGGRVNGETARVLGNLALAILLTYLSMTGQLGWLLDAIVSLWVSLLLVPIVGIGAFLWWAGRDIVQGNCPNCGNEFQVFKSSLKDDLQLCPFCTQPFSVVDDEFVKEAVKFSNQSTPFDQAFGSFSPRKEKGKKSSVAVVDVEAEIRDAD
ncbi:hypothetical protein F511_04677 [Dorcoceras hygrometricum]|uniref:Uncharacterized protein n=1 Tax=Dorcoceras hygrometricum TaxID=472368 RepID=A0A2Z7AZA4_9LAMI|nr:hypothetical protein F511_04677 [Dorcoceras hygrometricum]